MAILTNSICAPWPEYGEQPYLDFSDPFQSNYGELFPDLNIGFIEETVNSFKQNFEICDADEFSKVDKAMGPLHSSPIKNPVSPSTMSAGSSPHLEALNSEIFDTPIELEELVSDEIFAFFHSCNTTKSEDINMKDILQEELNYYDSSECVEVPIDIGSNFTETTERDELLTDEESVYSVNVDVNPYELSTPSVNSRKFHLSRTNKNKHEKRRKTVFFETDREQRKRAANRVAARRYREKRKVLAFVDESNLSRSESKLAKVRALVSDKRHEVNLLKKVLLETLKKRGIP